MARLYKRKSGLWVVSGIIVSVENTGAENLVGIQINERDSKTKQTEQKTVMVHTNVIYGDCIVGKYATAAGYQRGMYEMSAIYLSTENHSQIVEDVEILSGMITKAGLVSEVNEDGSPKLKLDGSPRKPHFDIKLRARAFENGEKGHDVLHAIKFYNFKNTPADERTEIEKAQRMFSAFEDRTSTPFYVTVVTKPSTEYTWVNTYNNIEYTNYGSNHLGHFFTDVNLLRTQDTPQRQPQQNVQPAVQTQPTQQVQQPMYQPVMQEVPTQSVSAQPVQQIQPQARPQMPTQAQPQQNVQPQTVVQQPVQRATVFQQPEYQPQTTQVPVQPNVTAQTQPIPQAQPQVQVSANAQNYGGVRMSVSEDDGVEW